MPSGIYKHNHKPWQGKKRPPFSKIWRDNLSKVHKGRIPWNKGKKGLLSQEVIEKIRKSQIIRFSDKTKHPRWLTDRTKLKKSERKDMDVQYIYWAKQVKERDYWQCKIKNSDCSGHLESHHILSWRNYPELRYDINNGITLCHFHHPRKRKDEEELSPYFQKLVAGK